jgi:hypothetical protein
MTELELLNAALSKAQTIGQLLRWCLGLILAGAIWAARLELRQADLIEWRASATADIKDHAKALENIKGRMGIAATRPPEKQPEPSPALVYKYDACGDEQPTQ